MSQEINRVYTGALGPVGVVPYTHENARGIGVVGVIDGGNRPLKNIHRPMCPVGCTRGAPKSSRGLANRDLSCVEAPF